MRKIACMIPAIALALAACGQTAPSAAPPAPVGPAATSAAQGTPQPTATQPPTAAPAATSAAQGASESPIAMPAATGAPTPTEAAGRSPPPGGQGTSVRPPDALVAAAQQRLAQHLGVPADTLALQSANRKEWPDGAIGCPEAGHVYPQVVTPGFLLVFSNVGQSRTYEVHTGRSEEQMVLCENNQPTNLADQPEGAADNASPAPTSGALPNTAGSQLVDLARQALAIDLGIDVDDITLNRVEAVEWSDSSLGCPRPGMNYLQVITPGYVIVLEAQGRSYEYHTDTRRRVVRCDKPGG